MTIHSGNATVTDNAEARSALVRRGLILNYLTLGYNVFEGIVSLVAGIVSGSVALVGFGLDSLVEVTSSVAAHWRLRADHEIEKRERSERISLRIIGASFVALAAYVAFESARTLYRREPPDPSILGVMILSLSVIAMPWIAAQSRRVAVQLGSRALEADSKQTSLCAWLSAIALAGVGLNYFFGLWWADAAAALVMVPIIANEGFSGLRGEGPCEDDCR